MPDKRVHRGPHPSDKQFFDKSKLSDLRMAMTDFCLLLSKGYAEKSTLKLVGDRFSLTERQRLAVMRSACSDQQLESRNNRRLELKKLVGQPVALDGYNILITIEAAISGGVIFKGRDGCYRDLASIHGTYRKVDETIPAIQLIGTFLYEAGAGEVLWLLDSPVSNSGRLKTLIGKLARENGWNCRVELSINPDAELKKSDSIVVSSDSVVLDYCKEWINLAPEIIKNKITDPWIVDISV